MYDLFFMICKVSHPVNCYKKKNCQLNRTAKNVVDRISPILGEELTSRPEYVRTFGS